jgi:hypothetical protein
MEGITRASERTFRIGVRQQEMGIDTMTRTFTIGQNRAAMTLSDDGALRVSWSPHMPSGDLRASELAHYMSARNQIIFEMAAALARNNCILKAYRHASWCEATP